MSESDDIKASDIRVIKTINHLKTKSGASESNSTPGILPSDSIMAADRVIQDMCDTCYDTIDEHVRNLPEIWERILKSKAGIEREELNQELLVLAHEIKDVASMCGYALNAYFAESLRDYVAKTDFKVDEQQVIIQAHIDAIIAVHKQKIKEDGGPVAEELKHMVKVAIEKHS